MAHARAARHRLSRNILARSRDLRHNMTEPERRLWEQLRAHRLGVHFRRQHALLGRFIPDFYCADARLCVEVDGDSDADVDQESYDVARTNLLERSGLRVLRFANRDVMRDLEAVIEAIRVAGGVG